MTSNQIDYWELQESKRSNRANEKETNRHNTTTEKETNRHNVATESIDLSKLAETTRHNKATEGIQSRQNDISLLQLSETSRHNLATEGLTGRDLNIQAGALAESIRHNKASEEASMLSAQGTYLRGSAADKTAQADVRLKELQSQWVDVLNANRDAIDEYTMNKIEAEIDKINSDIERNRITNSTAIWNSINGSLDAVAKSIDAIIPF